MSAVIVAAALVAGALAALVRYLVSRRLAASAEPGRLPRAVLIVNIVGSFIGGAAVALGQSLDAGDLRYVLLGGVAGGLTTFSTFSVETIQLAMEGRWRTALANVGLNLLGGLVAVLAGWGAVSALLMVLAESSR